MSASLVGSEMCIRDSFLTALLGSPWTVSHAIKLHSHQCAVDCARARRLVEPILPMVGQRTVQFGARRAEWRDLPDSAAATYHISSLMFFSPLSLSHLIQLPFTLSLAGTRCQRESYRSTPSARIRAARSRLPRSSLDVLRMCNIAMRVVSNSQGVLLLHLQRLIPHQPVPRPRL